MNTTFQPRRVLCAVAAFAASMMVCLPSTAATTLTVPGTANIYGAGHSAAAATPAPAGQGGGSAPPFMELNGATAVSFTSITGSVDFGCVGCTTPNPDGQVLGSVSNLLSYNGISGIFLDRRGPLLGVFIGVTEPSDPAPARLQFDVLHVGVGFSSLSPQLNQTFFIGDGLTGTGSGAPQVFNAPAGAVRLYVGVVDGLASGGLPGGYFNNSGSYQVTVSSVPEPEAYALMLGGLCVLGVRVRRRRERTQP